jgi:hypothetical protein
MLILNKKKLTNLFINKCPQDWNLVNSKLEDSDLDMQHQNE